MLYVYWVKNDDLKTTAWREQNLNATDSIQKKIWLGNQMMLFVILLEIFNLLLLFSPFRRVSTSFWDIATALYCGLVDARKSASDIDLPVLFLIIVFLIKQFSSAFLLLGFYAVGEIAARLSWCGTFWC